MPRVARSRGAMAKALTDTQIEIYVTAQAQGLSVAASSREAGFSTRTGYRLEKRPEIVAAISARRGVVVERGIEAAVEVVASIETVRGAIVEGALVAVAILVQACRSEDERAAIVAAKALMSAYGRLKTPEEEIEPSELWPPLDPRIERILLELEERGR